MIPKTMLSLFRPILCVTGVGTTLLFSSCASTSAQNSDEAKSPVSQHSDSTNSPSGTIKEGAGKMGEGIGDVARGAAQGLKETVCHVVGIRTTKVFYTKWDKGYESILKGEKIFSNKDNRECFVSAKNASLAGYTRVGDESAR